MKKEFLLLYALFSFFMLAAQTDSNSINPNRQKTYNFLFETGTMIHSLKGSGNTGYYFFSPAFIFNVTPRLNMKIQAIMSQPMFSTIHFQTEEMNKYFAEPNTNISFFAEGEYKLSEKIHITGSVYNNPNKLSLNTFQTYPVNHSYLNIEKAFSVGMYYQLNKNIQIGAEFRQVEYTNPVFFY